MKKRKIIVGSLIFMANVFLICGCNSRENWLNNKLPPLPIMDEPAPSSLAQQEPEILYTHIVENDIPVKKYFSWIESLAFHYDSLLSYDLPPQLIVHNNPWIIDSFAHSDYYYLMDQGTFVYDQKEWIIIHAGDSLFIPSQQRAKELEAQLSAIRIDVNLPEYKLRLLREDRILYEFPVRIGQPRKKFLQTEGREVDLHTIIGSGFVCEIILSPAYINFQTGEAYEYTRRDDGKTTLMPLIPTLLPEINGICHGQLIHATTNPNTLGKAYSHGCIGTREGDAWRIYFYSRVGTPIEIRYDLHIVDEQGDIIELPDVYHLKKPTPLEYQ